MSLVAKETEAFLREVFCQPYGSFDVKSSLIMCRINGEKPLGTAAHNSGHLLSESRQLGDMFQDLHGHDEVEALWGKQLVQCIATPLLSGHLLFPSVLVYHLSSFVDSPDIDAGEMKLRGIAVQKRLPEF